MIICGKRFFNFLRAVSRLIIGLTFIFSGFVKVIDPVGSGLIMGEYFKIAGLSAETFALIAGIFASVAELLLGISILLGLRMKISAKAALLFMVFFTLLTLYLAIFNPINDCGCFGEAIKLTHWQSFFKNIVLLVFAGLLYFQRDKYIPIAPPLLEWGLMGFFTAAILWLSGYSYVHLPMVDFMEYRAGAELVTDLPETPDSDAPLFETTFIYSKDGKNYEFSIDNIPDSTYTFVDAKTVRKGDDNTGGLLDFAVSDRTGTYITESLLHTDKPLFLATAPLIEKISRKEAVRLKRFADTLAVRELEIVLLTGSGWDMVDSSIARLELPLKVYHADYKTLLTMNRSSQGLVYLNEGMIIRKWASKDFPHEKIDDLLSEDYEFSAAKTRISEQISAQLTAFVLLIVIMIVRCICRWVYRNEKRALYVKKLVTEQNVDMSKLNTLGLKATALWYARPSSTEEVRELLADEKFAELPKLIIGLGSNILFRNSRYTGLVIHPDMQNIEITGDSADFVFLRVGAGVVWDDFVVYCVDRGWGGVENLSMIPGCVGASPVQNIGAYGSEVKDTVDSVEFVYIENGEDGRLSNEDCRFGYRDSIFKNELKGKVIITYVTFRLSKHAVVNDSYADVKKVTAALKEPSLNDVRNAIAEIRKSKLPDPSDLGNAGSFFKNPIVPESVSVKLQTEYPALKIYPASPVGYAKLPAAWLIDQCGFKGRRKGNVGVHDQQALVLVAYPGATGEELVAFADEIRSCVKERFDIYIEPEVQIIS